LALFGVLPVRRAGAMDCPPVAVVEGQIGIVREVRAILGAHGVASEPASCPQRVLRASLQAAPDSRSYSLHIVDAFGRTSDRRVGDPETAASLIESWAVSEAEGLAPPEPTSATAPTPASGIVLAAEAKAPPWQLAGALELSVGTDNSFWYGGTMTGCGRLAGVCLGARGRLARDEGTGEPSVERGVATRTSAEILAIASLTLITGRFAFTPMMGLGAAWTHSRAVFPASDTDQVVAGNPIGLRLEAATGVGLAVSRHVWLVGDVSVSLGRTVASAVSSSMVSGADVAILNPPPGYLRIGIGCQYSP
jgi:hypothetical protein